MIAVVQTLVIVAILALTIRLSAYLLAALRSQFWYVAQVSRCCSA